LDQPADSLDQTSQQPEDEAPPRRRRKPSGSIECQLGLLIGIAGLCASRLGQLWIAFDVFSQFTLQFAVVTAAFLIGWAMPRAKLLTAFVLLVLGIVAIGVWPHLASRETRVVSLLQPGERGLNVASFNTLWDNHDAAAVEAEIRRLDADVITLVEVGRALRPVLARLKDRYPHQFDCLEVIYCNFAVLSKLPLVDKEAQGKLSGPSYIRVRLGPEAGGLTVFAFHTIRFPHSLQQFKEVTEIARMVERTGGHKLVMGDFNATPFSRVLGVLQSSGNLTRLTSLPSWPTQAGLPQIAIDHIFVSPGLRLIEAERIGEPAGSDHYPVSARIAVPVSP